MVIGADVDVGAEAHELGPAIIHDRAGPVGPGLAGGARRSRGGQSLDLVAAGAGVAGFALESLPEDEDDDSLLEEVDEDDEDDEDEDDSPDEDESPDEDDSPPLVFERPP